MCTVVYIPDNNKVFFASLRDENPLRPTAISPEVFVVNDITVLAPKDTLGGGTWLGINDYKNVSILLNGGFKKHKLKEQYRKSRGLIVLELLSSKTPMVDWELMNLEEIEPFTLLVWCDKNMFHLVWDGNQKHRFKLDSTVPHIFSSSTLYNTEAQTNRKKLFQNWIATNPDISKRSLLNFFKSAIDTENGFIINRKEKIKTLSFSFIEINNNTNAELNYYDLQNFTQSSKRISMKKSAADYDIPV